MQQAAGKAFKVRQVRYWKYEQNSSRSAALDPHHNHFLLVDNPENDGWGGEHDFRAEFVKHISTKGRAGKEVPVLTICLGGGEHTFGTLVGTLKRRNPLIVVKDSGGAARAVALFVEECRKKCAATPSSHSHRVAAAPSHCDTRPTSSAVALLRRRDMGEQLSDDQLFEVCNNLVAQPGSSSDSGDAQCISQREAEWLGKICKDLYEIIATKGELIHIFSHAVKEFEKEILDCIMLAYRDLVEQDNRQAERVRNKDKRLQPLRKAEVEPHINARSKHPQYTVDRVKVEAHQVPWEVKFDGYKPSDYTHPNVVKSSRENFKSGAPQGWADPALTPSKANPNPPPFPNPFKPDELQLRTTYITDSASPMRLRDAGIRFSDGNDGYEAGAPINPRGRTGMKGRGLLGKWGPNHAADPIVTRKNPENGNLEVVAVQRRDTDEYALPGGMVDAGEKAKKTLQREFCEEAINNGVHAGNREQVEEMVRKLFEGGGELIYKGYVDDPRNTDNAWMETMAYHFHCDVDTAQNLVLTGGDDAKAATWLRMDPTHEPRYAKLYADHRLFTDKVLNLLLGHEKAGTLAEYKALPGYSPVPDNSRSWNSAPPAQGYSPVEYNLMPIDPYARRGVDYDAAEDPTPEEMARIEKRRSYEAPVKFDPNSNRPLNPRGRTGVQGRGRLWRFGANHATDAIVTRHHPRNDKLQVVMIKRTHPGTKKTRDSQEQQSGFWAIPGDMLSVEDDPLTAQPKKVKRAFEAEAMEHARGKDKTKYELAARIRELVNELFTNKDRAFVYKGYMDDPRNTDNAWMETTAFHFHCSRELGGLLLLDRAARDKYLEEERSEKSRVRSVGRLRERSKTRGSLFRNLDRVPSQANLDDFCWLTIHEPGKQGDRLYLTHDSGEEIELEDLGFGHADLLVRMVEQYRRQGEMALMQTVVTWGKSDVVQELLRRDDVTKQVTPPLIQKSFQTALLRAGHTGAARFEVEIVKLLLSHGAKAADVFLSGLFSEAGEKVNLDTFGYMKKFARTPAELRRASTGEKVLQRAKTMMGMVDTKIDEYDTIKEATSNNVCPWKEEHVELMRQFISGFAAYAQKRSACACNDLVFWAILCGFFKLSLKLWEECETPLRTALIARHMCHRVIREKKMHIEELNKLADEFNERALGVLNYLPDAEVARKVLQSRHGDVALLCSYKGVLFDKHRASTLDVALRLKNKAFLAHAKTQECIDDLWRGRSEETYGRVMLHHDAARGHLRTTRLVLAMPLALFGIHILKLQVNDLSEAVIKEQAKLHVSQDYSVPFLHKWLDYWKIPHVKRANYLISDHAFLLLQVIVFFQPLCGDTNISHDLLAVWVASKLLGEVQQAVYNWGLYRRSNSNILDLGVAIVSLTASILRYRIANGDGTSFSTVASSFLDYFSKLDGGGEWLQPSGWYYTALDRPVSLVNPEDECTWTVELEFLRLFAALSTLASVLHLLLLFRFEHKTGVLLITMSEMMKDLYTFLKPTLVIMLAFAFVFHLLTPNYRTADTLENMAPPFQPIPGLTLDFSSSGPFFLTFWALMGYYEPSDLATTPGGSFFAPLFLWLYLLVALVMLVNLLIAMFNERYNDIMKQSEQNWKFSLADLLMQNVRLQHPAPTPLNLLMIPWWTYRGMVVLRKFISACLKVEEQMRAEEEFLEEHNREQAANVVKQTTSQRSITKRMGSRNGINAKVSPHDDNAARQSEGLQRRSACGHRPMATRRNSRVVTIQASPNGRHSASDMFTRSGLELHRQLSKGFLSSDEIFEKTTFQLPKVIEVEGRARKEYLQEINEKKEKETDKRLGKLEENLDKLRRELNAKDNKQKAAAHWQGTSIKRQLLELRDEVGLPRRGSAAVDIAASPRGAPMAPAARKPAAKPSVGSLQQPQPLGKLAPLQRATTLLQVNPVNPMSNPATMRAAPALPPAKPAPPMPSCGVTNKSLVVTSGNLCDGATTAKGTAGAAGVAGFVAPPKSLGSSTPAPAVVVAPAAAAPPAPPAVVANATAEVALPATAAEAGSKRTVQGAWAKPNLAGGYPKNATWRDNPQYAIVPTASGSFAVALSSVSAGEAKQPQVGFVVIGPVVQGQPLPDDALKSLKIGQSQFSRKPQRVEGLSFEAGRCYVVVPCTVNPGVEGAFTLDVSCVDGVAFTLEPNARKVEVEARAY